MMDLKPCWCGGAARRVDIDDESENAGASFIECTRCGNTTNLEFGRKENLLDRWNTRPREDALQAEVEMLREALRPFVEQFTGIEDLAAGDQLHVWIKADTIINARAAYGEKPHD